MSRAKHSPELVEAIKKSLTGTESITSEGNVYDDNLPEGLTPDTVEAVSNYTTTFVASSVEAVGDMALQAMKKDKKLDQVEAEIKLGAFGKTDISVIREKEITIPPREKGGEASKKIQPGVTQVSVDFVAGRNSGLLGKARAAIKENFETSLK